MNAYKKVMKQIHASEEFKSKMQKEMMEYKQKEKRVYMKNIRLMAGSLVACAVIAVSCFNKYKQRYSVRFVGEN